jgi:predicted HD phosphohydrolase
MDVVDLLQRGAGRHYDGVSQLDHALQCALLARRDRADDEVVLAALLHDIGHLAGPDAWPVSPGAEEDPVHHHGQRGAQLVRPFVPARVAWLIANHVVAKRYLCSVDARYELRLSPVSRRSLAAQGGVLDVEERLGLEVQPWFADAVRIRRWDDVAKAPGMTVPGLADYVPLLERFFGVQSVPAPSERR